MTLKVIGPQISPSSRIFAFCDFARTTLSAVLFLSFIPTPSIAQYSNIKWVRYITNDNYSFEYPTILEKYEPNDGKPGKVEFLDIKHASRSGDLSADSGRASIVVESISDPFSFDSEVRQFDTAGNVVVHRYFDVKPDSDSSCPRIMRSISYYRPTIYKHSKQYTPAIVELLYICGARGTIYIRCP
jgi:hypothetical protein